MNVLTYVHLRNIYGSTGAGRVARQMVEHLACFANDRIEILADLADYLCVLPKVGEPWGSFRYHLFSNDTSRQQARWLFLRNPLAESFWPEAEVVYCTGESYVPTKRARLVVTLHDAAFFETEAHQTTSAAYWKQRIKWTFLFGVLARKADMFHTVSKFSAERLAHFFPSLTSRLEVVPNGVAARFFLPVSAEGEAAMTAMGLAGRQFVLLPRGLHYRKNAELVLAVWPKLQQRHPDLLLVISSHCAPAYAIRARDLGDSVRLTGFVSDEVLCSLYHAARVVWFPSRYEGFGIPVLEAMACGTPVVASDNSSLPEIAGDAACLVPTHSRSAHLDALEFMLRDESARQEMIARGKNRASKYTWAGSAAKLRDKLAALV
jgi:glycosyltransferase involved in cell wall biosynthesis